MGGLCLEPFFHFLKNTMETIEIDLSMKPVQDLNKPAHMGSLEPVRQVDIHIDRRHSMLPLFGFIKDGNRITNRFDANFFDIDAPVIKLALYIFHVATKVNHRETRVIQYAVEWPFSDHPYQPT